MDEGVRKWMKYGEMNEGMRKWMRYREIDEIWGNG